MRWPFGRSKGKSEAQPAEVSVWDRAADNLIAQGLDPARVARATRLVKRLENAGALPEGTVREREE